MISAESLDAILRVLSERKVNVFRYKAGEGDKGEEMEIVIPGDTTAEISDETTKNTTGLPHINLIGFHGGKDVDDE